MTIALLMMILSFACAAWFTLTWWASSYDPDHSEDIISVGAAIGFFVFGGLSALIAFSVWIG